MSLAPEYDYRQEQNMSLKPRSGRIVLYGNASQGKTARAFNSCLPHLQKAPY